MLSLTELEDNVHTLESRLISAGYGNNELTFRLFMEIGRYKSEGGKKDLVKGIVTGPLVERQPTSKAKVSYTHNAIMYSKVCEVYLRFKKATKALLGRKRGSAVLLTEVIEYVCKRETAIINAFGLEHSYKSLRDIDWTIESENGTIKKSYHIEKISTVGEYNIDDMYLDLAQCIVSIKLDKFMVEILKSA